MNEDAIELQSIRLRISLLEQAFQQVDRRDTNRIYLLQFELGSAYHSYNEILIRARQAKLQEAQ